MSDHPRALVAAGWRAFRPEWRVPARSLAAAVVGGFLGYGARIAYGCNIGAYFSGIASASVHGWLWLVAAFAGASSGRGSVRCSASRRAHARRVTGGGLRPSSSTLVRTSPIVNTSTTPDDDRRTYDWGCDDPRRERPLDGRHAARDAAHRQGPRPALARRKRIIVDLAAVSQIDSSGLCDVVTAHTAAVRQDVL